MQILFLDESGTAPPRPNGKQRYFVIGGLAMPSDAWHATAEDLTNIKKSYKIRGELKWRYFAPGNDDEKNPLRTRSIEQRDGLRQAVFELIASRSSFKIICCIAHIEAAYELDCINNADELYHATYKPVTERFQYYLQDLSRLIERKENGIIVCDHRGPKDDLRLRQQHQKLLYSSGEHISRYDNLIEGLFIAPSHMSIGIELADLTIGAIWRKFERNDSKWFDKISKLIRTGPDGSTDGYGIIKMPKATWR